MQIRSVLILCFVELDNGVHHGVPVDVLLTKARGRHLSADDFFVALQAALNQGDLIESSPGVVSLTALGERYYHAALNTE